MLSHSVLKRLREMQQKRRKETARSVKSPIGQKSQFRRDAPAPIPVPHVESLPAGLNAPLRGLESANELGKFWLIDRPLDVVWNGCNRFLVENQLALNTKVPENDHCETRAFRSAFPARCLFMDLETCGFAGAMVFLIGLVYAEHGRLRLVQLLARDYSEEKALLASFWQKMENKSQLVTFNGKTFDWPMICDRSLVHRQQITELADDGHYDLLHHARRQWKLQLPNCKLQTLERELCGRNRTGDIPGGDIPDAYQRFVQTKDPTQMRSVLHHNALDLVTLVQISLLAAN